MIESIKGRLVHVDPLFCVVETAGGVGYRLMIPVGLSSRLPLPPQEISLKTSYVIRENAQTLYGFLHAEERDLFELCLGLPSVGPKLAVALVGHLGLRGLKDAVMKSDLVALREVPGVGKKTAERLLVDLRDQIMAWTPLDSEMITPLASPLLRDAISALMNLGYTQALANQAVKRVLEESSEEPNLSGLIASALKKI